MRSGTTSTLRRDTTILRNGFSDSLPGPAYFVLEIPVDYRLPANKKQRERELDELIEWIEISAYYLQELVAHRIKQTGSPDRTTISLKVTQLKFGCDIALLRVPYATLAGRKPGSFSIWPIYPDDNDTKETASRTTAAGVLPTSVRSSINIKRMVFEQSLILEGAKLPLTRDEHIGHQLNAILTERSDVPDEILPG